MLGFAGLGIEVGTWMMNIRAMQGVADAAATGAATALALSSSSNCTPGATNICTQEARTIAAMNGWTDGANGVAVTVNNPPASGSYSTNNEAVEVIIRQPGTNWFGPFLPAAYAAPTIVARSVALVKPTLDCLLSLSNTRGIGIDFNLILSSVNMPNCSIGDNSRGGSALTFGGLGNSVTAFSATVSGGINTGLIPLLSAFHFTKAPVENKGTITPDPYGCGAGGQCRTMPAATPPRLIRGIPVPNPCNGNGGKPITTSVTPTAGTCYPAGLAVTPGTTITFTTNACTRRTPCYIVGTATAPAISVSGTSAGNATLQFNGSGHIVILGGPTRQPAVKVTGGTVNFGSTTVNIQGGTVSSTTSQAISLLGAGFPTVIFGNTSNSILAGPGSAAIAVAPTSGSATTVGGSVTFGNGNNQVQSSPADGGSQPAITIGGGLFPTFGQVSFGNGNSIIGCTSCNNPNVPAVIDAAGFGAGSGLGLILGSGTYQFMEGISVTGGDLTLNPSAAGVGTYIMDGGGGGLFSAGGFHMTFGNLIGNNATIVLTGGTAGGVGASDYANIYFSGANSMTLTAPTSGSTAGIAIFQDRAAATGNANTIWGGSLDNIAGAIYTPAQPLIFGGATSMTSQCTQMIASTITMMGLAWINDQCQGTGTAPISGNGQVILVE